ncbi:MAG: phosphoglycolate phosphatase [Halothiobacillaceae bacterium]|nr:MAG: phosphoglycolate phosphatase [Halothiobacillaceae bacterium]
MNQLRTVLFDLDGTLADTAPDLAFSLNQLLHEQRRAPLPFEMIRPQASHGAKALLRLGFGMTPADPQFDSLSQRLLTIYQANLTTHTRLFAGVLELLTQLESQQINWGIVTNKPAFLTDPLLQQLNLFERAAVVVSGDTLPQKKPHPAPMLYACDYVGSPAAQCLYIGDAERDIVAGKAAGMHTLVALFGYIGAQESPHLWGADGMINTPAETLAWVANINARGALTEPS